MMMMMMMIPLIDKAMTLLLPIPSMSLLHQYRFDHSIVEGPPLLVATSGTLRLAVTSPRRRLFHTVPSSRSSSSSSSSIIIVRITVVVIVVLVVVVYRTILHRD